MMGGGGDGEEASLGVWRVGVAGWVWSRVWFFVWAFFLLSFDAVGVFCRVEERILLRRW